MHVPTRILIDWGGTITKERELFDQIAMASGNRSPKFDSPDCWDKIRRVGKINYFDDIQQDYFKIAEMYSNATSVISSFYGTKGLDSDSEVFVLFDNKPNLTYERNAVEFNFAKAVKEFGIESNGVYLNTDKLSIVKGHGFDIVIDDDPRILLAVCSTGTKGILMLREWNRFFDLQNLKLSMRYDRLKTISDNLTICEDWYDAGIALGKIVDERKIKLA